MASGGTITINAVSCDSSPGTGLGGIGLVSTTPLHGSASTDSSTDIVTYVNNGDGVTSDSFAFLDSNGVPITVTVAIGPVSPITVSPATLPTPNVGTFYTASLSASGGTSPYTFTLTSGNASLPSGLTMTGNVISGTPKTAGTSTISVHVVDAASAAADKSYSITVPVPTITPSALPNPVQGAPYNQTLSASGGTAPYSYSLEPGLGSLPPGLSMNASGVFSGTPTTQGTYNFTIKATDSSLDPAHGGTGPYFNDRAYSLTVLAPPPLTLSPTSLSNGQVGVAYSTTVTASGGTAPYTYSVSAGSLPPGLTFNTSTGALTGTPTGGGPFNFTISAHDAGASTGSQAYALTMTAPTIVLAPATLPAATQNSAYSQAVTASGGTSTYTYAVTSGALPAGLSLSSAGVLSGTSTVYGTFTFQVTATDSSASAGPYTGTRSYSLTVHASPPVITTSSLPAGTVGTAYSQTIAVSGGVGPYTFAVTAGSLPAGLSLSSAGVVSGTPTAGGTFPVTVTVTDSQSGTGTQSYSLIISAPTVAVAPGTLPAATLHAAYSQTVSGSGGTTPYIFSVTSGALPPGVSLSSGGVLSGHPTTNGTYNFDITATDSSTGSGPYAGVQSYSVTVSAPTITLSPSGSLPAGQVAAAYGQSITASGGSGPYTYAVTSGALPAGLALSSGGIVSGTPTAGGPFSFTVTATDANTNTGSQSYTLTTAAPTITVAPATLPAATLHVAYNQVVSSSGGTTPYTFSVTSGALPPGVSLSSGGALSGHPTTSGTYTFDITATDSSTGSGPYAGVRSYSVTVSAPTITLSPSGSLPAGQVAAAYSQSITASGGSGPYTYAVTSGALPAGLALSSGGVVSGTPTAGGNFSFTVTATDVNTNTGSQSYTLTTTAPTITVGPATLPVGTDGVAYSQSLNASGGTSTYKFTIASGALPPGLNLATDGTLSGTPTGAGLYSFTVQAQDSSTGTGPYTGSRSYNNFNVANPTLTLAPGGSTLSGTYIQAYTQTFTASGGTGPYTYAESGTLPTGVTWNALTATLSGTPIQSGNFPITITATDSSTGSSAPFSVPGSYTLSIAAPTIAIAPGSVPAATVGTAYSQTLTASGGASPYTYTVSAGAVPAGLSLSSAGVISGTPTAAGPFSITVQATDAHGASGSQTYSATVNAATVVLSPATLPAATAESAYSQTVTASGGTAPYTYAISAGALPAGVTLNTSNGALSGTPTVSGPFNVTIRATDSSSGTGAPFHATQSYALTVNAPSITVSPGTLGTVQVAAAFSQPLSASGGNGSYTYAVSAGSLPPGTSLSSAGLLTGTPTTAGSYSFSVTATDGLSFTGTQAYSGTVIAPSIVVNPSTLPAGTAESAYTQTVTASGGTAPYTYAISAGALPAGLSFNTSSGALSGTPTVSGTFNVTIRATDSSSGAGAPFSATRSYSLSVNAPGITVSPGTLSTVQVAAAFSQPFSASGGNGSYTYAVSAGSLPPGLTLSAAGLLAGTPTAAGSYSFSVTATDGLSFTGTKAYSVTVNAPSVVVNTASLPAGTAESAYAQTVTASGGTAPYTYAVSAGALPAGLTLNAGSGALSGTPTVSGTFNVTIRATDSSGGAGAPFSATRSYTLSINAPGITVSPGALSATQVAVAFSQQFSASGGNGSYTYTVSAGSLPSGLTLSAGGLLAGTPTAAGSYSFSVTATDGLNFTGARAFTVNVGQPVPVAVNDNASTLANSAATLAVTTNDTGPITSIAIAQAPTHGTASVSGLNVIYTPTANYYGSDTLTYTATGPGGTSAPATVSITVTPLAVPVASAQTVTILAGKPVTIHATAGATGAPFTVVAMAAQPATGTATVSGTDIVYTPPANASGKVSFTYTIANAFGVSAPATVTVTVNPMPVAPSLTVNAVAGTSVQVDLTRGAQGGPFTDGNVLSITPAQAGTATLHDTGSGYMLSFAAAPTFSGAAQISFTLNNAYATSLPGTITVDVAARSDPSHDTEVLGILAAQADATRRMATGQIGNFQRRLESLHSGGVQSGFSNGLSFSSGSNRQHRDPLLGMRADDEWSRRYLVQPNAPAADRSGGTAGGGGLPGDIAVWTGGAVNFGSREIGGSSNGIDFTTSGISVGADKQITSTLALGAGLGYGHDASDIGHHGSRSTVDSYNFAFYGSYRPSEATYIDALAGYQWLSFDARRYVTDNGSTVQGSRDGNQVFGSLSVGYERRRDTWVLSPYARLDLAHATLDGYTEHGGGIYALSYQHQTVDSSTGSLGLRGDWVIKRDYGVWMPRFRIEYQRDFEGAGQATMRYADLLTGPVYHATLNQQVRNHTLLGLGLQLQTLRGLMLRVEYQNLLDNSSHDNQSILLGVEQKFKP